jgi:RimJ/RimL family protein N-acetyltransferase
MDCVEPTLLNVPEEFFTERLQLRMPDVVDAPEVNAAVRETWEALNRWLPWAKVVPEVEETEEVMRTAIEKYGQRTDFMFLICAKPLGEYAGAIGLHLKSKDVPRYEIGYWCRASCEGRGYISEAVREVTRIAFELLNAQRVEILADTENSRSAAVAVRCGFAREGVMRNWYRNHSDDVRDMTLFSMIREDYLQQAKGTV